MYTTRLEIRPAIESDRDRFVALFLDTSFMVFAGAVPSPAAAHRRFDQMLAAAVDIPFAKQPVIDRTTGMIVGYCGAASFELEGGAALEFGYRLCPSAQGRGFATEAGLALLDLAGRSFEGVLYAMIDPTNGPSMRVIDKLGFTYWKMIPIDDYHQRLYRFDFADHASVPEATCT